LPAVSTIRATYLLRGIDSRADGLLACVEHGSTDLLSGVEHSAADLLDGINLSAEHLPGCINYGAAGLLRAVEQFASDFLGLIRNFAGFIRHRRAVAVHPFPVAAQRPSHLPQKVRGQVGNLNPRQDQKPRVVGQEANVAPPGFRVPADIAVAAAQMPRAELHCQAGDRAVLRPCQIFQMLADRLFRIPGSDTVPSGC
jgi:hypothetical protein